MTRRDATTRLSRRKEATFNIMDNKQFDCVIPRSSLARRKRKDAKFGFGGNMRVGKANSRDSVKETSGYRAPK